MSSKYKRGLVKRRLSRTAAASAAVSLAAELFATVLFAAVAMTTAAGCDEAGEPISFDDRGKVGEVTVEGPTTAGLRRLSVDELQASIPVAAGLDEEGQPIIWRTLTNGKLVDALSDEGVGTMLGRPDYVAVTAEDTSPNSLYVKFARDMSREVCDAMVKADLARSGEATLWRYAPVDATPSDTQLTQNTQYLVLRFLSLRLDADDPMLASFREVYAVGSATFEPGGFEDGNAQTEGWRAVCIALLEDPAFHIH